MKIIFKYIFLTAIRDWLYLGLLITLLFAFSISSLVGTATLNEEIAMQLTLFGGASRLIITCGMILFICFHINKSFETKEIQFILAKNISRYKFIFSYWLSFNIISFLLLIPVFGLLLFCDANLLGLLQWITSLFFELLIVSTFAIISSLILKSAVSSVLGTFGFYLIARLMGFFASNILFITSGKIDSFATDVSYTLLKSISMLFPRLDLFGQTKWLIYGAESNIFTTIIAQTLIYIPIMLIIAYYDFRKKEF